MMRALARVGVVCLIAAACMVTASAEECTTCGDDWASQPPFEQFQTYFSPYTLGLSVGARAPSIDEMPYAGTNTLVVVINRSVNPDFFPLIASWAEIPELQVVVLAASMSYSARHDIEQILQGTEGTVVPDPHASILSAGFLVGERTSPITFLIDSDGVVVYRRRGFPLSGALELDSIVRGFAASGVIAPETIMQHVLWYEDVVPWPEFSIESLGKEVYSLEPGQARLIFFGYATGNYEGAFAEIDALRSRYLEVEFIWLQNHKSEQALQSTWEYAQAYGLVDEHPEVYRVPLADYLQRYDSDARRDDLEEQAQPAAEAGWTVLIDVDNRLITLWNLFVYPAIVIISGDGVVHFPCTPFPVNLASGQPVVHPLAVPELERILDTMLGH